MASGDCDKLAAPVSERTRQGETRQGKNLCNSPIDYIHSSAKYYLVGEAGYYIVTDVEDC